MSIWKSLEISAISKDLDYAGYISLWTEYTKTQNVAKISEKGYIALKVIFHEEMINYFAEQRQLDSFI